MFFSRFVTSDFAKMVFLWLTISLNGVGMIILPFLSSFGLLAFIRAAQYGLLGAYITADSSIVVFTMGPIKSRPFTNALHAFIGIGLLAATFLVRPFLPDSASADEDRDAVCFNNGTSSNWSESNDRGLMWGVDPVAWPFVIAGLWCCIFSIGYLILGKGLLTAYFGPLVMVCSSRLHAHQNATVL